MRKPYVFILAICFLVGLSVASAQARPNDYTLAQTAGFSQDDAAAKVRRQTGGRVLDVQTGSKDGVTIYLVKVLLPDGRVRVVSVSSP